MAGVRDALRRHAARVEATDVAYGSMLSVAYQYLRHRELGTNVVLFVRDAPRDELGAAPFLCLGRARRRTSRRHHVAAASADAGGYLRHRIRHCPLKMRAVSRHGPTASR